jgi:hypothetical protein
VVRVVYRDLGDVEFYECYVSVISLEYECVFFNLFSWILFIVILEWELVFGFGFEFGFGFGFGYRF